jgi:hypothetical protein
VYNAHCAGIAGVPRSISTTVSSVLLRASATNSFSPQRPTPRVSLALMDDSLPARPPAGCCDNFATDEDDALRQIRQFLSYLPSSVWELPERVVNPTDSPHRTEAALSTIIPNERKKSYDMRRILQLVFDHDSWFEIGPFWGRSLICGLARLDGYAVGECDCLLNLACNTYVGPLLFAVGGPWRVLIAVLPIRCVRQR